MYTSYSVWAWKRNERLNFIAWPKSSNETNRKFPHKKMVSRGFCLTHYLATSLVNFFTFQTSEVAPFFGAKLVVYFEGESLRHQNYMKILKLMRWCCQTICKWFFKPHNVVSLVKKTTKLNLWRGFSATEICKNISQRNSFTWNLQD